MAVIRRERPEDEPAVRAVEVLAFRRPDAPDDDPPEAHLLDRLRTCDGWMPALSLVALLGSPAYYGRFGFVASTRMGIDAPEEVWGDDFQARPLSAYGSSLRGTFRYAAPFEEL